MKENYSAPCLLIDKFGDRWSINILLLLREKQVQRFGELQKALPGISQRMLTLTLRTLENLSLIERTVYPEVPPKVEYKLTELGVSLMPLLDNLREWANQHAKELTQKWKGSQADK